MKRTCADEGAGQCNFAVKTTFIRALIACHRRGQIDSSATSEECVVAAKLSLCQCDLTASNPVELVTQCQCMMHWIYSRRTCNSTGPHLSVRHSVQWSTAPYVARTGIPRRTLAMDRIIFDCGASVNLDIHSPERAKGTFSCLPFDSFKLP